VIFCQFYGLLKRNLRGFASIDRHQNALVHFEIPFPWKARERGADRKIPNGASPCFDLDQSSAASLTENDFGCLAMKRARQFCGLA
jgi:hypothetical protein